MNDPTQVENSRHPFLLGRTLLIVLIMSVSVLQLVFAFRGLSSSEAMDQAQVARNVANGEGFRTNVLRPRSVMDSNAAAKKAGKEAVNLHDFRNTGHAPLNIAALAVGLKLTGHHDFEKTRMEENNNSVYTPDRVIASTTLVLFIVAMVLSYIFITRIFDETVAIASVAFMSLSSLMLNLATSGLPQMLMLTCLMSALLFLEMGMRANRRFDNTFSIIYVSTAFVFVSLLCLSGWLAIWCALGLLIFVGFTFRPYGISALIGLAVMLLILAVPVLNSASYSGSIFGSAYYSLSNSFGHGSDFILRSTQAADKPLEAAGFAFKLFTFTFGQVQTLFTSLGAIIVTPFFFLAIFNKYKKPVTNAFKWAGLCMWATISIGMALFGSNNTMSDAHIFVLLTPIFVAYGVSLVYIFIARMQLGTNFGIVRNFTIVCLLIISAGPFAYELSVELVRRGGAPHNFPPYSPPTLNTRLPELVDEKQILVSDQPWATAWYTDRVSLWSPLKIDDIKNDIMPILAKNKTDISGFLVTPTSFAVDRPSKDAQGGIMGVNQNAGDLAPLALEGSLQLMSPKKNFMFTNVFPNDTGIGQYFSQAAQGIYNKRHYIYGAYIILYTKGDTAL